MIIHKKTIGGNMKTAWFTLRYMLAVFMQPFIICCGFLWGLLFRLFGTRAANASIQHTAELCHMTSELLGLQQYNVPEIDFQIDKTRPVLVLAVHPQTIEAATSTHFMYKRLGLRHIVFTVKEGHIFNPIGWTAWATGGGILRRGDKETSGLRLKRLFSFWRDVGSCMVLIYPTGTRGDDMKRERARKYLAKSGKDHLQEICDIDCLPRPGGTLTMLQHMLPDTQIVFVNMATEGNPRGIFDPVRAGGLGTFHMDISLITEPVPRDEENLHKWLEDMWLNHVLPFRKHVYGMEEGK